MKVSHFSRRGKTARLALLVFAFFGHALTAAPVPTNKPAAFPAWWFSSEVIPRKVGGPNFNSPAWPANYPEANDYAAANIGQLKNIASKANAELHARLPSPVWSSPHGTALLTMVNGWTTNTTTANDYAALNLGQLKNVAVKFYDVLKDVGYTTTYPWTTATTDDNDFAVANLGQLKKVFSFNLDSDGDGLFDAWEIQFFGDLTRQNGSGDFDQDGHSNLLEFLNGTDPKDCYNGVAPSLEIVSGNGQSAEADGQFSQPLRARVRNPDGQALVNAPVAFTVQAGTGNFSILNGVAHTGPDGIASISFQSTSEAGASIVIAARAGLASSVAFSLLIPSASEPPTAMEGTLEAWIVSPHRVTLTWSGVSVANCQLERRTGATGEWTLEREVTAPGGGETLAFITSAEESVFFRLRTVAPQTSSVTAAVQASVHPLPAGLISLPMSSCVERFNGRGQFGYVGLDGVIAKAWDGEKWQTLPGDPLGAKSVGGVNEAGDISGSVNKRAVIWRWNSETRLYALEYISAVSGFEESYAGRFWRDGTLEITFVNVEKDPIGYSISHLHALKWVPSVGWVDLGDQGSTIESVLIALGFEINTTYQLVYSGSSVRFRNMLGVSALLSLPIDATATMQHSDYPARPYTHDTSVDNPIFLPAGAYKDYPEFVITGYKEEDIRTNAYYLCAPGTLNAYPSPLFSNEPDSSREIGAYNDRGDRIMQNLPNQFEVQLADGNVQALTGLPQPSPSLSALGHYLQVGGHFLPQEDPDETDYDGRPFIQFPAIGDKPIDTSFLQLIVGREQYGGRVQSMNRYGYAAGASDFGEGGGAWTGYNPVLWGPEGRIVSLPDVISATLPGIPNAFGYTYPFWYVGPTSINDAGMILCASTELPEENPSQRRLLLPMELVDSKDGIFDTPGTTVDVKNRDVVIAPKKDADDKNPKSIAWIEPHGAPNEKDPEMPQLAFHVGGIEQMELKLKWKLEVKYKRPNNRTLPEDTVMIQSGSNDYTPETFNGTLKIFEKPAWTAAVGELSDPVRPGHGFFGGDATLTWQLIKSDGSPLLDEQKILFRISGKNPDNTKARDYLSANQPDLWFAYAICKHETSDLRYAGSFYNQFVGNPNGKKLIYSKYGRTFPLAYGEPIWNWDYKDSKPGGFGLFQVTGWQGSGNGNIPRDVIWNWRRNMDEGANEIRRDKVPAATKYFNAVKTKYGQNIPDPPLTETAKSRKLTGWEVSVIVRSNGVGKLDTHPELRQYLGPYTQDPWTYSGGSWSGPQPNSENYLNKLIPQFE